MNSCLDVDVNSKDILCYRLFTRTQVAEWYAQKDLCNKIVIPLFVLHLKAESPLVENSQSPSQGLGLNQGPYGLVV